MHLPSLMRQPRSHYEMEIWLFRSVSDEAFIRQLTASSSRASKGIRCALGDRGDKGSGYAEEVDAIDRHDKQSLVSQVCWQGRKPLLHSRTSKYVLGVLRVQEGAGASDSAIRASVFR